MAAAPTSLYDAVASDLYVSRGFVKHQLYMLAYGAELDPWLRHLITQSTARALERV